MSSISLKPSSSISSQSTVRQRSNTIITITKEELDSVLSDISILQNNKELKEDIQKRLENFKTIKKESNDTCASMDTISSAESGTTNNYESTEIEQTRIVNFGTRTMNCFCSVITYILGGVILASAVYWLFKWFMKLSSQSTSNSSSSLTINLSP